MFGNLYSGIPGFEAPGVPQRIPEKQFTDVLVEKQVCITAMFLPVGTDRKQIKKLCTMDLGGLARRDYTLRISLELGQTSHV